MMPAPPAPMPAQPAPMPAQMPGQPWGQPPMMPAGQPPMMPGQPPMMPGQPPTASLQRPAGYGYPPATNYAPGYYPPVPPKKSGPSKTALLIGLVLVPLVIITLIVIVKAFTGVVDPPPIDVTPTAPTTTSATTPGDPGTTAGPGGGGYMNDDYVVPDPDPNPPDLPAPQTYGEAADMMTKNVFYNGTAPSPVRCDVNPVDPSTASKEQMSKYLNEIVVCLMRVWGPELTDAGFNANRPTAYVYTGEGQ